MAKTWCVYFFAVAPLLVTGCSAIGGCETKPACGPRRPAATQPLAVGCVQGRYGIDLDRGDWAVRQTSKVWKVFEAQMDRPPQQVGYLVGKSYRQMRGGPNYGVFNVTTMNRNEVVGRIDQMGRAWRYEPRRDSGFEEVDLGSNTMENNVSKILGAKYQITLEQTSARHLAFEALDRDGNGTLEASELQTHGDRVSSADTNGDGKVDFAEFDRVDVL